jgi:hypothetical protein
MQLVIGYRKYSALSLSGAYAALSMSIIFYHHKYFTSYRRILHL